MGIPDVLGIAVDHTVRYGFQVLAAMAIFVVKVVRARLTARFIERWLKRASVEMHLQRLLVRASR